MSNTFTRALLINEDRQQYVQLVKMLESVPSVRYEMTWCADYRFALEAMLAPMHDVIFLDFEHAPDVCYELLRAATAQDCKTPIICLTPAIDHELDRAAIRAGAADYMVKSELDAYRLERTVRYAIDRKRAEAKLARLAHYDLLTGIPNRLLFSDRLDRALQRATRSDQSFALLYIDLDGFKAINDNHGHDAGDAIVRGVAERVSATIRRTDSVARIGGDEFVVLLEQVNSTGDITSIAQKIIDAVVEPFVVAGKHLRIGCSIGIAVFPDAGVDAATLMRNADMAMYEAKGIASSNYRFFTKTMNVEADDQSRREMELRAALKADELSLHYQPRTSLRSGKVVGAEALLRWDQPSGEAVSTGKLVELAEQTGLISELGYWILNHLCREIALLDQQKAAPLRFSVNISLRQFADSEFVDTVKSIIGQHRVNPARIEFELAERDVLDNLNDIAVALQELNAFGVHFSIDDFGTGFSSLPQLQQLPVSSLKLDPSHVQLVTESDDSANIVRAMISLAHELGMQVIAEGVETEQQKAFLAAHRCDQLQGYVFSPPMPFDEFGRFIQQQGVTSRRSYLSVVDR